MGIRANELAALLNALRAGVRLNSVATIGRQEILQTPDEMKNWFNRFTIPYTADVFNFIFQRDPRSQMLFAEHLLEFLGATEIRSIDASIYEDATDIVDLCKEVPIHLRGQFDLVLDCGTLEHIFDVPRALYNSLSLVKPGGHYLAILPCNNQMGHGFYQFSPEFFCSTLVENNGFELERQYLFEDNVNGIFYEMPNPRKLNKRVELANSKPASVYILARCISKLPEGGLTAYQSDYLKAWTSKSVSNPISPKRETSWVRATVKKVLPPVLLNLTRKLRNTKLDITELRQVLPEK
jgi:SAM-dependent methyltransferase